MVAPVEHFSLPCSSSVNSFRVFSKTEEGHMMGQCLLLTQYTEETPLSIKDEGGEKWK